MRKMKRIQSAFGMHFFDFTKHVVWTGLFLGLIQRNKMAEPTISMLTNRNYSAIFGEK